MEGNPFVLKENPMYRAKTVLTQERNWKTIPRNPHYEGWSLSAKISRLASKMVRHSDEDEREADGAVHWNALKSTMTRGFRNDGAEKFTDSQWRNYNQEGSNKVRFEYCENSQNDLVNVRAIQGHSGTLSPELMNHVLPPPKWKDIENHKGSIFNMKSIMADGLIQEETNQEDRLYFLSTWPIGIRWWRRRVSWQHCQEINWCSKWKYDRDVVYWVELGDSQDLDCDFGRRSQMPSLCMEKCRQIAFSR